MKLSNKLWLAAVLMVAVQKNSVVWGIESMDDSYRRQNVSPLAVDVKLDAQKAALKEGAENADGEKISYWGSSIISYVMSLFSNQKSEEVQNLSQNKIVLEANKKESIQDQSKNTFNYDYYDPSAMNADLNHSESIQETFQSPPVGKPPIIEFQSPPVADPLGYPSLDDVDLPIIQNNAPIVSMDLRKERSQQTEVYQDLLKWVETEPDNQDLWLLIEKVGAEKSRIESLIAKSLEGM